VAPTLLTALSTRPAQHQDMLLRLFVAGLQPGGPKGQVGKKEVSRRPHRSERMVASPCTTRVKSAR
jgi:hypothetical protein